MLPDIPPCAQASRVPRQRILAGGNPVGCDQSLEPTCILHGFQIQNFRNVRSMKTQSWMEPCFVWKLTKNHLPFEQVMFLRWHGGRSGQLSLGGHSKPGLHL